MPGYERTPFFSAMSVFKEQPSIAAFISTDVNQTIPTGVTTALTFATPLNMDPLNVNAWQTLWSAATPGQFTIGVRGVYLMGASILWAAAPPTSFLECRVTGALVARQTIPNSNTITMSTMHPLGVGATVIFGVFQSSAGNLDITAAELLPNMWIVRVG